MSTVAAVRRLVLLAGALAAFGCALRTPQPTLVPEQQDVDIDAKALKKFYDEIEEYVELRKDALKEVKPVSPGASAQDIDAQQNALTEAIRAYRKDARQGEMFKPPVEAAIRRIIVKELAGPEGPAVRKAILQGNPSVEGNPNPANPTEEVRRPVTVAVNARYPEGAPFSSVPPSLLLKLPQLPDVVRYRFVGADLILRDTEANLILDVIKSVVPEPK